MKHYLKSLALSVLLFTLSATPAFGQAVGGAKPVVPPDPIGGGHVVLNDDLQLTIDKYLSLDGVNYYSTPQLANPFYIPEQNISKVHAKAIVKNTGELTAIKIRLRHDFDPGLSDMKLIGFTMTGGAVTYNPATGIMGIDELAVGDELVFFYDMSISEEGVSPETAADILTLESYESRLPIYHAVMGGPSTSDIDHLIAGDVSNNGLGVAPGLAGSASDGSSDGSGSSSNSGMSDGPADEQSDIAFILPRTGMTSLYWLVFSWLTLGCAFYFFNLKKRY